MPDIIHSYFRSLNNPGKLENGGIGCSGNYYIKTIETCECTDVTVLGVGKPPEQSAGAICFGLIFNFEKVLGAPGWLIGLLAPEAPGEWWMGLRSV